MTSTCTCDGQTHPIPCSYPKGIYLGQIPSIMSEENRDPLPHHRQNPSSYHHTILFLQLVHNMVPLPKHLLQLLDVITPSLITETNLTAIDEE